MTLDAEAPDPPDLKSGLDAAEYDDTDIVGADDYRRDELEEYLQAGAWEDAWEEWAETTDLTDEEYAVVQDLGLLREFDFFWDDFADRVGYHAPGIPEDWRQRDLHPELDAWETASAINAGLTELGQIVSTILKEEYVEWESEFEGPDDLPDFETE